MGDRLKIFYLGSACPPDADGHAFVAVFVDVLMNKRIRPYVVHLDRVVFGNGDLELIKVVVVLAEPYIARRTPIGFRRQRILGILRKHQIARIAVLDRHRPLRRGIGSRFIVPYRRRFSI